MNNKLIVIIAILATSALAHHECNGLPADLAEATKDFDKLQGFDVITEDHLQQRQELAASGNYRQMRIFFDLTALMTHLDQSGMSHRKAFYTTVFAITGKWWENALSVNDDQSSIWPRVQMYMNYYLPKGENQTYLDFKTEGSDTSQFDIFIKVNMGSANNGATTLAYAGPFVRHSQSQRPISGAAFVTPYGDTTFINHKTPMTYATSVMIHEFGHIFGFTSWEQYQPNYIGVANNKHIWKGPKVLALAREFYDCQTLEGVPLQTQNGRVGAHWNEEVMFNELMTPMAQSEGNRLSALSLALLEDTAWYKPDYSRSEHFTFGKGEGCSVSSGTTCPSPSPCASGTSGFITSDYQGTGYCTTNAQGCNIDRKYSNRNCMVESGWPAGNIALGAHYGNNCAVVSATLKYVNGGFIYTSNTNISVYAQCDGESSYELKFINFETDASGAKTGKDAWVKCTEAGTKQFNTANGYASTVTCVDPAAFCAARFGSTVEASGPLCHKSCNSYGRCQKVSGTPENPFRLLAMKKELSSYGYEAKQISASGQWQCWCYSDFTRTSGACAAV